MKNHFMLITFVATFSTFVSSQELPDGAEIIDKVNQIEEGAYVTRNLHMKLVDRRGKVRERHTISMRKYYGLDKKTIIFYITPTNVKDTSFLTIDYADSGIDDDQWLYLPAMRKTRRISSGDRGDYFLGTDFTYEDIKKEGKIAAEDYTFETVNATEVDGYDVVVVKALPKNEEVAEELGHSMAELYIDAEMFVIRKSKYWDVNGNDLKTITTREISLVNDILTRHRIEVENHKTGHQTTFTFSNVDYETKVDDSIFSEISMKRGWKQ